MADSKQYGERYLDGRYRSYEGRAIRYRLAGYALMLMGFNEHSSILDIGGGDREMERCLREEFDWEGEYRIIDHAVGLDIEKFFMLGGIQPGGFYSEYAIQSFKSDFVVCLETIEHFHHRRARHLVRQLEFYARKGVVVSTPNANVQNVYDMDATHLTGFTPYALERCGYTVEEHMLYDGFYSNGVVDGLIGYKQVDLLGSECPRHGGSWGADETCATCTNADGTRKEFKKEEEA